MTMFILFGNHSCANRGDAAISRGLIEAILDIFPDVNIEFYTRYPGAGEFILNQDCQLDVLGFANAVGGGKFGLLRKLVSRKLRPIYLYARAKYGIKWFDGFFSPEVKALIKKIEQADCYIHVGGSFFVDIYGLSQFEGPLIALAAKKHVVLVGHSVGPFVGNLYRKVASFVFGSCNSLLVREAESVGLMEKAGIPLTKVIKSADTAWLAQNDVDSLPAELEQILSAPTIALTVRDLRPFDRRLGFAQADYEQVLAKIVDDLNAEGYKVVFASTCTGLDSYGKDDRIVALRITKLLSNRHMAHVVMDEMTDNQLAAIYQRCSLVLATRLHSAILAMRAGTPALAIYYEHKSQGILEQMGLKEWSLRLNDLPTSIEKIITCAKQSESLKPHLAVAVKEEQKLARETLHSALARLK